MLGAAATEKPDLGGGFTPEGLSRLQLHLSAKERTNVSSAQEDPAGFVPSKASQDSSREFQPRFGCSHGILRVLSELYGTRRLLEEFASLVEGGVQARPDQMQPSSTKKRPSVIPWSSPTFHQLSPPLLPPCTAALPPKINTDHPQKPQAGFNKRAQEQDKTCALFLCFSPIPSTLTSEQIPEMQAGRSSLCF